MVGGWIASYVLFFFFKQKTAYEIASCLVGSEMCIRDSLGAAAFRVHRIRRGNVCLEDQAKACSPTDQPVRKFNDSSGINKTMKTLSLIHI